MAIQKKSLLGAGAAKQKNAAGTSDKNPEAKASTPAKLTREKKLAVAKLATAKLSTAKLTTLRRLS